MAENLQQDNCSFSFDLYLIVLGFAFLTVNLINYYPKDYLIILF